MGRLFEGGGSRDQAAQSPIESPPYMHESSCCVNSSGDNRTAPAPTPTLRKRTADDLGMGGSDRQGGTRGGCRTVTGPQAMQSAVRSLFVIRVRSPAKCPLPSLASSISSPVTCFGMTTFTCRAHRLMTLGPSSQMREAGRPRRILTSPYLMRNSLSPASPYLISRSPALHTT